MGINIVVITGNLTRDSELSVTNGGASLLRFSVAVNDRMKNQQTREWEDRPNYVDCVLWGRRAEALEQYLAKGQKVSVCGRLRWSNWESDGQKRSKLEVVVEEVELMGRRNAQDVAQEAQAPRQVQQDHPGSQSVARAVSAARAAYYEQDIAF